MLFIEQPRQQQVCKNNKTKLSYISNYKTTKYQNIFLDHIIYNFWVAYKTINIKHVNLVVECGVFSLQLNWSCIYTAFISTILCRVHTCSQHLVGTIQLLQLRRSPGFVLGKEQALQTWSVRHILQGLSCFRSKKIAILQTIKYNNKKNDLVFDFIFNSLFFKLLL